MQFFMYCGNMAFLHNSTPDFPVNCLNTTGGLRMVTFLLQPGVFIIWPYQTLEILFQSTYCLVTDNLLSRRGNEVYIENWGFPHFISSLSSFFFSEIARSYASSQFICIWALLENSQLGSNFFLFCVFPSLISCEKSSFLWKLQQAASLVLTQFKFPFSKDILKLLSLARLWAQSNVNNSVKYRTHCFSKWR